jgi:predicted metalloprotease with PDZ domain
MFGILIKLFLALIFSGINAIIGQQAFAATEGKPEIHTFSANDIVFINELGAIVKPRDKSFFVDMVSPGEQRGKEYQSVDLKKDDEILMINGKKVTALTDLKSAYDAVVVGQDVKFGIRRGKSMMIVSFPKADAAKMQQHAVYSINTEEGGDSLVTETIEGGAGKKIMRFGPGGGNIAMLSELGVILEEADSKIKIIGLQDDAPKALKNSGATVGDVVVALQTTKVSSIKELQALYDKIETGKEFSLSIEHAGKVVETKAIKAAKSDRPQIIRTIKN